MPLSSLCRCCWEKEALIYLAPLMSGIFEMQDSSTIFPSGFPNYIIQHAVFDFVGDLHGSYEDLMIIFEKVTIAVIY